MNNAKMWLVVPPKVGVPVFLGAVAVGSFAVHVAVLSNTTWVSDFLSGQELGSGAESASLINSADPDVAKASYTRLLENGLQEVTVVLKDGSSVRALLQPNEVLASSDITPRILSD